MSISYGSSEDESSVAGSDVTFRPDLAEEEDLDEDELIPTEVEEEGNETEEEEEDEEEVESQQKDDDDDDNRDAEDVDSDDEMGDAEDAEDDDRDDRDDDDGDGEDESLTKETAEYWTVLTEIYTKRTTSFQQGNKTFNEVKKIFQDIRQDYEWSNVHEMAKKMENLEDKAQFESAFTNMRAISEYILRQHSTYQVQLFERLEKKSSAQLNQTMLNASGKFQE